MANFHDTDFEECFLKNNKKLLEKCKDCLKCDNTISDKNKTQFVCLRELNNRIILETNY
jgi:hypothetical protein